jgi:hypothetical protein
MHFFEKYFIIYFVVYNIIRTFAEQLDARATGKGSAKAKQSFNPSHLQQVASCMISGMWRPDVVRHEIC